MRIVLAVARVAILRQHDLGDVAGHVAGLAIKPAVGACQRVARLCVVIKAPPRPAIRVVAERAIRPQAAFMMLVPVTGGAIQRGTLERQRAMAFLARHDGMAPNERESGDVVIEGLYATPTRLAVALLAAAAELALVRIILPVTGYTGRPQLVAVEIASVAGIALHLRMRCPQRKFRRLVMIEANREPLVLLVAAFAFGAVPSGVNILNLVAIDARGADPLVAFAAMARGADDGPMCALERELGLVVVVRFDATPCRLAVTTIAGFSQAPLVRLARLVTVEAASGRVAKFYRLRMTAAALHGFVRVPKLEVRKCMVEGFAIELDDIGIPPLVIAMTMGAFLLRGIRLTPVESLTRRTIRSDVLMTREAQARL